MPKYHTIHSAFLDLKQFLLPHQPQQPAPPERFAWIGGHGTEP
jgi:hypothetical protein